MAKARARDGKALSREVFAGHGFSARAAEEGPGPRFAAIRQYRRINTSIAETFNAQTVHDGTVSQQCGALSRV